MHIPLTEGIERICLSCRRPFKVYTKRMKHKLTPLCSERCKANYQLEAKWAKPPKEPKKKRQIHVYITTQCLICQKEIIAYKERKHPFCSLECRQVRDRQCTKGSLRSQKSTHTYSSTVRKFNREWNKDMIMLPCAHCGYAKHVQLAHIKAVADFPDTATMAEINAPSNVLPLCPNCHWEFDNLPRKGALV